MEICFKKKRQSLQAGEKSEQISRVVLLSLSPAPHLLLRRPASLPALSFLPVINPMLVQDTSTKSPGRGVADLAPCIS